MAKAPDPFAESTPPPRLVGRPLPPYTRLVEGEDAATVYRTALADNRVSQGSELLLFCGTNCDRRPAYEVCETSGCHGLPAWPLGERGTRLDIPAGWVQAAVLLGWVGGRSHFWVVWSPVETGGRS